MGNTHSAGHPNRLSKPKTNTNSPHGNPKLDSPVSVSSRYAELGAKDRYQTKTQVLSHVETESEPRASSDGDGGLGELACRVQRRLSTLSRSNSLISHIGSGQTAAAKLGSLQGSKLSLVSHTQQVDLDTAMRILEVVKKNASPEDLVALHHALEPPAPSSSSLPDQGPISSEPDGNRSTSSLTRRRSLIAIPGLATRYSPTGGAQKTGGAPKPWNSWNTRRMEKPEDPKWKVEMMLPSPLGRLASLDPADGRESPTLRAQTPGDLDYSHLGSLKLGSLVVTNGAPSPAPSARNMLRRKSAADISREDDYFTVPAGRGSEDKMTKGNAHSRSKSALLTPTPPPLRERRSVERNRKANRSSQCDSPLRVETQARPIRGDIKATTSRTPFHMVNRSAEVLAKDYRATFPNSPYSPKFEEKNLGHDDSFSTAIIDDAKLHREEALSILDGLALGEYITEDVVDGRQKDLRSSALSNCTTQDSALHEDDDSIAETTGSATDSQRRWANGRPTPRHVDSGYSSGGSLRIAPRVSLDQAAAPSLSEKSSTVVDRLRSEDHLDHETGSLYTFEQMLTLPVSRKPLPPIPVDEDASSPMNKPEESGTFWHGNGRRITGQTDEWPDSIYNLKVASPTSPRTIKSVASQWTIDSNSSQKRLQKGRPPAPDLPVVQSCQATPEGTIPSVPENVRAKFVRRLSESPGMECLTQTFQSTEHVKPEKAAVHSPSEVTVDFPSSEPRQRKHNRSLSERPPTPPPHGVRRRFSLFRKQTSDDQEDRQAGSGHPIVVDLGTIAGALGESPYDAALPALSPQSVTSPTHPYQLGNAIPRVRSMMNMDGQDARMQNHEPRKVRPRMPQRPRSFYDHRNAAPSSYNDPASFAFEKLMPRDTRSRYAGKQQPDIAHGDAVPVCEVDSSSQSSWVHGEAGVVPTETGSELSPRIRTTGRGEVVSQMIDRYDEHTKAAQSEQQDWAQHAQFWAQKRRSIGEGLRQSMESPSSSHAPSEQRPSPQPSQDRSVFDRYGGGLAYGYERGHGIGGSAGTRQLHSAASRKSMQFSHQYGVDLSDVPVFLQRRN